MHTPCTTYLSFHFHTTMNGVLVYIENFFRMLLMSKSLIYLEMTSHDISLLWSFLFLFPRNVSCSTKHSRVFELWKRKGPPFIWKLLLFETLKFNPITKTRPQPDFNTLKILNAYYLTDCFYTMLKIALKAKCQILMTLGWFNPGRRTNDFFGTIPTTYFWENLDDVD